jgi:hypothetical protein
MPRTSIGVFLAALSLCCAVPAAAAAAPPDGPALVRSGDDVRVTSDGSPSYAPAIAWSGTEFGIAWIDQRDFSLGELYFARVSGAGAKLGDDVRITNNFKFTGDPAITWGGGEWGAACLDERLGWPNDPVYFARISAEGVEVGDEVPVKSTGLIQRNPSIAFSGSSYAVVCYDELGNSGNIMFATFPASGPTLATSFTSLAPMPGADIGGFPVIVWTGSEYGVAWVNAVGGQDEIFFTRVSAAGSEIGTDVRVTDAAGASTRPRLAWSGTEFGLAWQDARDGNEEIYFQRIAADGMLAGGAVRVTDAAGASTHPDIAYSGAGYTLVWSDARDGNTEIYLARLSASGEKLGGDLRLTDAPGASSDPVIAAAAGTSLGVAWADSRDDPDGEVYFARVDLAQEPEPPGGGEGCLPAPPGLVASWKAEDDAADELGGAHGALAGGAGFADGMVGRAFALDGNDDHVEVGRSDLHLQQITLECWAMRTSDANAAGQPWGFLLSKYDHAANNEWNFVFAPAAGAGIHMNIRGDMQLNGVTPLVTGVWYHLAATYDGETMRVYVNGALDGEMPYDGGIPAGSAPVRIGANSDAQPGEHFAGLIDEAAIYDRALTDDEVRQIYEAGATGRCPPSTLGQGLLAYWPLDEGFEDASGNGRHLEARDDVEIDSDERRAGGGSARFGPGGADHLSADGAFPGGDTSVSLAAWFRTASLPPSNVCFLGYGVVGVGDANGNGRHIYGRTAGDDCNRFPGWDGERHLNLGVDPSPGEDRWWYGDAVIASGVWYHWVATYDAATRRVRSYIDGALDADFTLDAPLDLGEGIRVGMDHHDDNSMDGWIDEVAIWTRALSEEEVAELHARDGTVPVGPPPPPDGGGGGVPLEEIARLDGRIDALEGVVDAIDGRLGAAEDALSTLGGDLSGLESRVGTAEGDIAGHATRITTAEGDIAALGARVGLAEGDIAGLKTDASALKSDVSALDARLDTAEEDVAKLSAALADAKARLAAAEAKIAQLLGAGALAFRVVAEKIDGRRAELRLDATAIAPGTSETPVSGRLYVRDAEGSWILAGGLYAHEAIEADLADARDFRIGGPRAHFRYCVRGRAVRFEADAPGGGAVSVDVDRATLDDIRSRIDPANGASHVAIGPGGVLWTTAEPRPSPPRRGERGRDD